MVAYEHAIRKRAVQLVNGEGKSYPVALKEAWRDATIKELNFTTPLALYSKRSHAPPLPWRDGSSSTSTKAPRIAEGGKGQSRKGKPNRKSGPNQSGCASHTPEGDLICFRYNTVGEKCKEGKCKYKHVCGLCFAKGHPLYQCNAKRRADPPPDTAGKGPS